MKDALPPKNGAAEGRKPPRQTNREAAQTIERSGSKVFGAQN
jgi:hypothetical protein